MIHVLHLLLGLFALILAVQGQEPVHDTGTKCICKPTMTLEVQEPSAGTKICNNATFDWLLHTILAELSQQKEVVATKDEEIAHLQEQVFSERKAYTALEEENARAYDERSRAEDEVKRIHQEMTDIRRKLESEVAAAIKVRDKAEDEVQSLHQEMTDIRRKLESEVAAAIRVRDKAEAELHHTQQEIIKLRNENTKQIESAERAKAAEEKEDSGPKDCADIQRQDYHYSGIYSIYPTGYEEDGIEVFCDLNSQGGGWLMIQRRQDGSTPFDMNWAEYKAGFGRVAREFWLGNELLHQLTQQRMYELRIDMADFSGNMGYASYTLFMVDGEDTNYTLHIGQYEGNNGDSLGHHNGQQFSTKDVDNDKSRSGHCSQLYGKGGWWFVRCFDSNLNGAYGSNAGSGGLKWYHWGQDHRVLKYVEMKIRPVGFGHENYG